MEHGAHARGRNNAWLATLFTACAVTGCGGSGGGDPVPPAVLTADGPSAGTTPFIANITLRGKRLPGAQSVEFTIASLPGTVSKPVHVTYSIAYLVKRGDTTNGASSIRVPVFGLYAGHANTVNFVVSYADGTSETVQSTVQAAEYHGHATQYQQVQPIQARAAGSSLGYDFFYIKSQLEGPVVMDTDGILRWVGAPQPPTPAVLWTGESFVSGVTNSGALSTTQVDGSVSSLATLAPAGLGVVGFSHDLAPGKTGILGVLSTSLGGVEYYGDLNVEFGADGALLQQWSVSQILSDYMRANGDDPTLFVRPGVDWWHQNSQLYDPSDDSLILSSRENFVMKIDHATGAIRWILGDTTKYWHTFASLRAKALTLVGDGLAPVGQHALSIAPDGSLLMFNDGLGSTNVPLGQSPGISRTYSAVSDYVIDEAAGTATNAWNYLHQPSYFSPICSSVKQMPDQSMLIDYSYMDNGTHLHLVGLDANRQQVFDYELPTSPGCGVAWNAEPIGWDALNLP